MNHQHNFKSLLICQDLRSLSDASLGTQNRTPFNCRWENWSLISWLQSLHNSSSNFRFFSRLSCTSLHTSDQNNFLICVQIRDRWKASSLCQCCTILDSICNWGIPLWRMLSSEGKKQNFRRQSCLIFTNFNFS